MIYGQQDFFSSNLVGRIFFYSSARIFFYYLCAACNFFSSDKRLQEIFFQNHPPPPSRVKWSAPKSQEGINHYASVLKEDK